MFAVDYYYAMKFEWILRKIAYHTLEQRIRLDVHSAERETKYKLINVCQQ